MIKLKVKPKTILAKKYDYPLFWIISYRGQLYYPAKVIEKLKQLEDINKQ